ncbi:MAG: PilZ domain-containing protein, partial [Acidobacteriota bacterium]|nr:PilZ domain-containing protein [Acidobacteriota bacterium]
IREGVEVAVDGNPAALIDLSMVGAMVVSPTVLKPNQRVRVIMGDGKAAVRCSGAVVWAAFEMPKGMPTRYRAGLDWGMTAEASSIETFAEKNKKA